MLLKLLDNVLSGWPGVFVESMLYGKNSGWLTNSLKYHNIQIIPESKVIIFGLSFESLTANIWEQTVLIFFTEYILKNKNILIICFPIGGQNIIEKTNKVKFNKIPL